MSLRIFSAGARGNGIARPGFHRLYGTALPTRTHRAGRCVDLAVARFLLVVFFFFFFFATAFVLAFGAVRLTNTVRTGANLE